MWAETEPTPAIPKAPDAGAWPIYGMVVALSLLLGCNSTLAPEPPDPAEWAEATLYLESADFRADALEQSLVNTDNGYARLRLEHYSNDWSELPERNPASRVLVREDIGEFRDTPYAVTEGLVPLFERDSFTMDDASLMELGERAFFAFPMSIDMRIGAATLSEANLRQVGLWIDPENDQVGGLVRMRTARREREFFAVTCSTCHAREQDHQLVPGAANTNLDFDSVMPDGHVGPSLWGPGRLDVTPDGRDNPVALSDLRPLRHMRRLHRTGNVRNDLISLAIRIETLLITAYEQRSRPPREVCLALAYYILSLAPEPSPDAAHPGAELYAEHCGGCHGITTPEETMVSLARIGTDPQVGESMRGTGGYRVPTLVLVLDRPGLLNQGLPLSVRELMNTDGNEGHGYGRRLADADKDLIVDYLRTW